MVVTTAQERCNSVLDHVRSTNLNFLSQETSYSVYLTIRKSFVKNVPNQYPADHLTPRDEQVHTPVTEANNVYEAELNHVKTKLYQMEAANATLTKAFEDEVEASNNLKMQLNDAGNKLDNLHSNFSQQKAKLENIMNAKIQLEKKHEETCNDVKVLKSENSELKKELG